MQRPDCQYFDLLGDVAPLLLVLPLLDAPPLLLMPPPVDPELLDLALLACSGAAACSSRDSLPSWFLSSLSNSALELEDDVPPAEELDGEVELDVPPAEDDDGEDDLLLCDVEGEDDDPELLFESPAA